MNLLHRFKYPLLILTAFIGWNVTNAQSANTGNASLLMSAKNYVFKAQTALPMRGSAHSLTPNYYELKISKDTITSFLPFFGRAYTAPMNADESGFKFTSTSFVYSEKEKKKGGWDVQIKPKDTKDVRQMLLNISSGGMATLQIISNNRETISFTGVIEEAKK
jgi:hypothetical protein